MAREDVVCLLSSEFKLWGVSFTKADKGSGHIELRWQVSPYKDERSYIVPKTSGDSRSWLNCRADIRRLFRADGLPSPQDAVKHPAPKLHKALALPQPVETYADQIKMLRAEVGDLTDLVLGLCTSLTAQPAPAPEPVAPVAAAAAPKGPSVRSVKTLDFVSEGWVTEDAIVRDMGLPRVIVRRKLAYVERQGLAEQQGGRWRLRPVLQVVGGKGRRR